jgi:putative tryptophan/tyrosine transport system substrate-binding protein
VAASALATVHRDLIITLAARHKLPAVYFNRVFVTDGGLISYGADFADQYRHAAGYIDRILKGEKPADIRCRRRPLRRSASTCRTRCSRAPTR